MTALKSSTQAAQLASATSATIRLASWNLRYDSQPDQITVSQSIERLGDPLERPKFYDFTQERPWSERRIPVANVLREADCDIIGFQEALIRQVDDLQELLGGEDVWGWVGVGRDDGKKAGEYSPIFYKKSSIKLLDWDSFWLSNTPFEPSRYPGAGSYRVCTCAHLLHIPSNTPFTLLNTHLDDRSDAQRRLGASLLLHRAAHESHHRTQRHLELAPSWPKQSTVLVMGDFNSAQTGRDAGAYEIATGITPPFPLPRDFEEKFPLGSKVEDDLASEKVDLESFTLVDLKARTPRRFVSGHYATYTGFVSPNNSSNYTRIDFVFGGSSGSWQSESYSVGNSLHDDGLWLSDHRPVFVEVKLG